ncbi:M20 family metallopeptidase [Peribacillus simplex]|uniref:M20 family metallopeptidase n=2 Tax=Peribacillus TaxID=2675229 RepID=A0AA90SLZ9_9BACI|nr:MULTISPECIES: M20 family metallopeptidase [Peribacillus]MDP1420149.1 M20 family metallopeptidase [Peribacillus simplex]MDP1453761.1 M20 family metallopeptidase [Peribacillus frigoritolerans]
MNDIQKIGDLIEHKRDKWIEISNQIWEYAETRFEEVHSADLLCQALESEGFSVEKGLADIPTAFVGSFGTGNPVVAILGEYDALSGLSQKSGVSIVDPVESGGNGHGCGHNLLGTGSLSAAVALKDLMEQEGLQGTVRYYGCPAEEGGSGKTYMTRAGCFDDVDFALCWHPWTTNTILPGNSLANYQIYYKFKGKSAHAAAQPHLGRSALDAVELMNVGVNYLREHIISEARVHYAITNTGGFSPNVVQAEAEVLYLIRAPKTAQVQEIYERVCNIARGAALMTETEVEIVFDKACSNLVPNSTLNAIMAEVLSEIGAPTYNKEEIHFAEQLHATLAEEDKANEINKLPKEVAGYLKDRAISDIINPYSDNLADIPLGGSTDVGDVSWNVPTAQIGTACWVLGTPAHTWQVVTIGATSIAHKGMLQAGKVLAGTALEVMKNPELLEKCKHELKERLGDDAYQCPIPKEVVPAS